MNFKSIAAGKTVETSGVSINRQLRGNVMYYDIIGTVGVLAYLLSYYLLQSGKIEIEKGYTYSLLNLLGATFVLISLTNSFNLPSLVSQAIWIALSFYGLLRTKGSRKPLKGEDPRARIIYNYRVLGQTDQVYVDGRMAWSRTHREKYQ